MRLAPALGSRVSGISRISSIVSAGGGVDTLVTERDEDGGEAGERTCDAKNSSTDKLALLSNNELVTGAQPELIDR